MLHASLLQRIPATCRGRQFNTSEDFAEKIPEATCDAIKTALTPAIRRGHLRGRIHEQGCFDGSILIVSQMRGR